MAREDYTKYLIGVEILEASWDSDSLNLIILKDGKKQRVELDCYSECCSSTWIESIDGFENLKGIVYECENMDNDEAVDESEDMDNDEAVDESDQYSCIRYNFVKFRTQYGRVTLDFRNESNGYYSGWLDMTVRSI